jgi:5-methylcytosine-specific restriction enzyme subunit McrC
MHICELVHENLLVNEQTGKQYLRDFIRDKRQMARLFEHFVYRFYQRELESKGWKVKPQEHLHWDSLDITKLLPEMQADAILRGDGRVVLVECKFYSKVLQSGLWSQQSKIRSSHLYQVMTYLRNMQATLPGQVVEGLLVYPAVEVDFVENLTLSGHPVRVCTVDLAREWKDVETRMLQIIASHHSQKDVYAEFS